MNWLKSRASEPSTWRGLVMIGASVMGFTTSPDVTEGIVLLAMSLTGAIGATTKG